jgi:exodeoxyribonuclease V alpha subunit
VLQKALNQDAGTQNFVEKNSVRYFVGDKVMQIENNYNKNIFNGDIGFINSVNFRARSINIMFDDRIIEYTFTELNQIVHAYAITIHKSQGGEYPVVILPVVTQHFVMLNKNLMYTALTRAKKAAILLGQRRALAIAVNNISTQVRHTMLSTWIDEICDN